MPTEKPRISFALSDELLSRVDEYRFDNRIKNRTQAVIQLMNKGLEVLITDIDKENDPAIPDGITEKEREFLTVYGTLTPANRRLLLGIAELLLQEQAGNPDAQE